MTTLSLDDLPYVNNLSAEARKGRQVIVLPYFLGKKWHIPMLNEQGKLFEIPGIPQTGVYIASEIQDTSTDIHLRFLDLLYRFVSWHRLLPHERAIVNNITKLFTSIAKIDVFKRLPGRRSEIADFAASEIEYMLVSAKSIFDYLQELLSSLLNGAENLANHRRMKLPRQFSKMVKSPSGSTLTPEEIANMHNLPLEYAAKFSETYVFYEKVNTLRNDIVHDGRDLERIFNTDRCFGSTLDSPLMRAFPSHNKEEMVGNGVYSIRPLLSEIVAKTIESCDSIIEPLLGEGDYIAPVYKEDFQVFLREPHHSAYFKMNVELKTSSFWTLENPGGV